MIKAPKKYIVSLVLFYMIRRVKYSNNTLIINKLSYLIELKPKVNSLFIEISLYLKRDTHASKRQTTSNPSIIL